MFVLFRRALVLCLVVLPLSAFAFSDWQQPTADELSMKSYPADPDAPAVYLFREETVDDTLHMHSVYARIKILTEKGKEMFGEIELPPYVASTYKIDGIAGRTIQPNGAIVPFTGKPYDKLLVKAGGMRIMEKVFALPDVHVGSILEYRYKLRYDSHWDLPPYWLIQQKIPVLKAHYNFVPSPAVSHLAYSYRLPSGNKVTQAKNGSYDLTVENIPALPDDTYLPPIRDLSYRLIFYYASYKSSNEFWKDEGEDWSKDFDHFAKPSGGIRDAVNGVVSPGDNDLQKVQKIYAAAMKLDNTSFTRERSDQENKAEHLKVKTAQDIWAQQRGDDDQITGLFVAMVRAAGLKAYGAIVVNRDENLFDPNYLSWSQLDDDLAIVVIDGKEVYFDPGQRYCEFGKLHWKHTWAGGIRQTGDGTQLFTTPAPNYTDNVLIRTALLTLDPDRQVHGFMNETMTGVEALAWRQAALTGDEAEAKKQFEDALQASMPPGVHVKMNQFVGLTDFTRPLEAVLDVSGTLGTQTGKYIFVPAVFFEAGNAPLFAESKRNDPVDMHYPYTVRDGFKLTLPSGVNVESMPKGGEMPFAHNADYVARFVSAPDTFEYGRLLLVAEVVYAAPKYPALRNFFQKVSADDQEQVALKVVPAPVTAPATAAAPAAGK